jgi:glutathione S-transferase
VVGDSRSRLWAVEGDLPLKLFYMPKACSLASHIALLWAGADYELIRLDHAGVHAAEFLRLNPKGAVPVLLVQEQFVLTESLAILLFIADRHPASHLDVPATDVLSRAKLNEMLAELVSEVHKAFAPTFVPERYTTDPNAVESTRSAAYIQLDKVFMRLEGLMQGKEWLLFGRRTVADAYLYVMCRWKSRTPTALSNYPSLARFKARLDADPGVLEALREEDRPAGKMVERKGIEPSTSALRTQRSPS